MNKQREITRKRAFNRIDNMPDRELRRAVWIAGAFLVVLAVLSFGYYYVDRYVRLGNQSASDSGTQKLEQAVRDSPQSPEARMALAQQYLNDGMYAQAIDQAEQVLNVYPDRQDALLIAGTALTRANRPQEAVAKLEALVKSLEDNQQAVNNTALEAAYYFLGQDYNALGQHDKALTALESALKYNPTDADTLYQAGLAAQATKQYDKAVDYYNHATRLVPNYTEAYSGLIDSYTALNQPDNVAYARGMQAFSNADYKTAQTHLEYAVKALPKFAPAYYGLALTYEKLNRTSDAFRVIQSAMQLDRNNIAIQQAYGRIQNAQKGQ
jgi:tetratricopeptide (TPR) repeat protein